MFVSVHEVHASCDDHHEDEGGDWANGKEDKPLLEEQWGQH